MSDRLSGKTALITGASAGIGAEFTRALAERKANLVLVARREERLRELADELVEAHGIAAQTIAMDLAVDGAGEALWQQTEGAGQQVDVLINNAGYGIYGSFLDAEWERTRGMLRLNMELLSELSWRFGRGMAARGEGWILQVASIGGYQPSPWYAAYSATKAYVLSLGEALNYELREKGVNVTVLSPGVTRSEFLEVAGQEMNALQKMTLMEARPVVEIGLRAMLKGRQSVVAGTMNKAAMFMNRLWPRPAMTRIAAKSME